MISNRLYESGDDRWYDYRGYYRSGDGNGLADHCEAEPPPVSLLGPRHPVVNDLVGLFWAEQGVEALPFVLEVAAYLEELADLGAGPPVTESRTSCDRRWMLGAECRL
jgi:hypothetical protein